MIGGGVSRDDFDRESFLQTLADACAKTGWEVHAFCLMPNHFHLVVETPQANLVAGMKWFSRHLHGAFQSAASSTAYGPPPREGLDENSTNLSTRMDMLR